MRQYNAGCKYCGKTTHRVIHCPVARNQEMEKVSKSKSADVSIQGDSPKDAPKIVEGNYDGINSVVCVMCKLPGHDLKNCLSTIPAGKACRFCKQQKQHAETCRVRQRLCKTCGRKGHTSKDCPMKKQSSTNVISTTAETESKANQTSSQDKNRSELETDPQRKDKNLSVSKTKKTKPTDQQRVTRSTETTGNIDRTKVTSKPSMKDHPSSDSSSCSICGKRGHASTECFLCFGCGNVSTQCLCSSPACPTCKQMHCQCKAAGFSDNENATGGKTDEEFEISMDDLNLDMEETTAFQPRKSIHIQLKDIVSDKSYGSEDAEGVAKGTSDVVDDKEEEVEVAEIKPVVEEKIIDIISLDSDEEKEGNEQSRSSNVEDVEKSSTNHQLPPMRCFKCWGVSNDSSHSPVCFACGKQGHAWFACSKYNGNDICFNCKPTCSICGKISHSDVDCPDKNKSKSSKGDAVNKKTKQNDKWIVTLCFACEKSGHRVACCPKAPWMRGNRCIKCQAINKHCSWCSVRTTSFCFNCAKAHKKRQWVKRINCKMFKNCFQCGSSEHPWTQCALQKSGAKNTQTENESTPEKTNTSKVDSVTADPPVIKCYACYKTGHRRESCPEPKISARPAWEVCNDAKECFGCGERGHQYTDCPTRQNRISASSAADASVKAPSRVMCFKCGLGAAHSTNECPLQKKNIKNVEVKLRAVDMFVASASDTADNESESEEGGGNGKLTNKDSAGAEQATEEENPSTTQTKKTKHIQQYDKSTKWDSRLNKCKKCYKLGHFENDCPQSEADCRYLSKVVDTTPLVKHKVTTSVTTTAPSLTSTTPSLTSAASKLPEVDVKKMESGMCKICHCKGHEPEYCPLNYALALCKRVEEKGKEVNKREVEKERKIKALEKQRLAKMIQMQENELIAERQKKEIQKGQQLLEEEMKERNNTSEKEKKSDLTKDTKDTLDKKPEQKSGKGKAKAKVNRRPKHSRKSLQRQPTTGPPMHGPPIDGPPMGGPQMLGPNMGGPQIQGPNMGRPQMPIPNMGGPHMEGPNMGGPHMEGPNMGGPHMEGPNMGGPQMQGPNIGGPQMQGHNMGGPQMQGPNMDRPQMHGPNTGGSQMQGPNMGGPQMHGPNIGGSQMQGPNMGGPYMGRPQMHGPNMGGPNMGGPQMHGPNMGGQMQGPTVGGPQMQMPHMGGPMQRQPFVRPPLQGPHMSGPPYQGTLIPMVVPPFPGPPSGPFMGPQSSPNMQFVPRGPPGPMVPFLRGPSPVQPPQFGYNQSRPMPVGPQQGKPPSKIFDDPNDPMKAATELMRKFLESSDSSSDCSISSRSRSRSQSPIHVSKSRRSLSRSRSRMNNHKAHRYTRSRSRERGLKARRGSSPERERKSPNSRRRSRSPVYPSYFGPDHGYRDMRTHEEYYGPLGSVRESFYPQSHMDPYPPGPDMSPGPPHLGEDPRVRLLNYFERCAANIQHDLQLDGHYPRPPYEHYPEDIPSTSWSHDSHGDNCICKQCRSTDWEKHFKGTSKADAYSGQKHSGSRENKINEHSEREHSRSREMRKDKYSGRVRSRSREKRKDEYSGREYSRSREKRKTEYSVRECSRSREKRKNEHSGRERSRSREERINIYSGRERSRSREERIKKHLGAYRIRSPSNDRNRSRTRESERLSEVNKNRTDWPKNDDTDRFRHNSKERYHNQSRDWKKSGCNDRPNTRNSSRERERSKSKDASSSTKKSTSNKEKEKSGNHEKHREKFAEERDRSPARDRKKPGDSHRDQSRDMSQGRYRDGEKESSTDLQREKLKEVDASRNKSRQVREKRSDSDNSSHSKAIDRNGNSLVKLAREREWNASFDQENQKCKSNSGDYSSKRAKADLQNVSTDLVSDRDRSEIGSSVLNSENPFNTLPVNMHDSNSLDSFETSVVQNELVKSHRFQPQTTQVDVNMNQTRCEGETVNETIQQSMGNHSLDTSMNEISHDSMPHGEVIVDILGDDNESVSKLDAVANSQHIERTEETAAPAAFRGRGQSRRGRGRGTARGKTTRGRARSSEGAEFDSTGSRTLRSRTRSKRGCGTTTRTGDQKGE